MLIYSALESRVRYNGERRRRTRRSRATQVGLRFRSTLAPTKFIDLNMRVGWWFRRYLYPLIVSPCASVV